MKIYSIRYADNSYHCPGITNNRTTQLAHAYRTSDRATAKLLIASTGGEIIEVATCRLRGYQEVR